MDNITLSAAEFDSIPRDHILIAYVSGTDDVSTQDMNGTHENWLDENEGIAPDGDPVTNTFLLNSLTEDEEYSTHNGNNTNVIVFWEGRLQELSSIRIED